MGRFTRASVLVSLGVGVLAGCPERSVSQSEPQQGRVEIRDIPFVVNRDLDVLFLIDDSPSMADKQVNLADNFPRFIEVLREIPGGLPDVHIGVVTSDLGTLGAGDAAPGPAIGTPGMGGCSGSGKDGVLQLFGAPVAGGRFLSDIADASGRRIRNYTGELSDAFARMARAGDGGCGFEQHLEAIQRALGNPANGGFLRDDAALAVIIIADEDDCSLEHASLLEPDSAALGPLASFRCTRFGVVCDDGGQTPDAMNEVGPKAGCHPDGRSAYLTNVADHAAFLKGLKRDPSKIFVAGILGATEPFATELRALPGRSTPIPALAHSCTYTGGDGEPEVADPPIRLKAFLDQFPNRNAFASICQRDLSGPLQQIATLLSRPLPLACLRGKLADVDPETAGLQYDCAVSLVLGRTYSFSTART